MITNETFDDGRVMIQQWQAGTQIPTGDSVDLVLGEEHGGGHH
jgi:hypothetical protein